MVSVQGGPLPVVSGLITSIYIYISRVITPVAQLFSAIYRGPITPFIAIVGAHPVFSNASFSFKLFRGVIHGTRINPIEYSPWSSAWFLKMMVSKRNFLFWGLLFRFHVKFRGCSVDSMHHWFTHFVTRIRKTRWNAYNPPPVLFNCHGMVLTHVSGLCPRLPKNYQFLTPLFTKNSRYLKWRHWTL